jgi:hypothetical protein
VREKKDLWIWVSSRYFTKESKEPIRLVNEELNDPVGDREGLTCVIRTT